MIGRLGAILAWVVLLASITAAVPAPALTAGMDALGNLTVTWQGSEVWHGPVTTSNVEKYLNAAWQERGQCYGQLVCTQVDAPRLRVVRTYQHVTENLTLSIERGDELICHALIHNRGTAPLNLIGVHLPQVLHGEPTWLADDTLHYQRKLAATGEGWGKVYPNFHQIIGGSYATWRPHCGPTYAVGMSLVFRPCEQWQFYHDLDDEHRNGCSCAVARTVPPGKSDEIITRWQFADHPGFHLLDNHRDELTRVYGPPPHAADNRATLQMLGFNRQREKRDFQPLQDANLLQQRAWILEAKERNYQGCLFWGAAWETFSADYPLNSAELTVTNAAGFAKLTAESAPQFQVGWLMRPEGIGVRDAQGKREVVLPGDRRFVGLVATAAPEYSYFDSVGLTQHRDGIRSRVDLEFLYPMKQLRPTARWVLEFGCDQTAFMGYGRYTWWSRQPGVAGADAEGFICRDIGWRQMAALKYLTAGRCYGLVSSIDNTTWAHDVRKQIGERYHLSPLVNDYEVSVVRERRQPGPAR